jgi:hypothetical protein
VDLGSYRCAIDRYSDSASLNEGQKKQEKEREGEKELEGEGEKEE